MTTVEAPFVPARELPNGRLFHSPEDIPHGLKRYDNKKIRCRCEVCKEARRAYDRERYQKNCDAVKTRVKARADADRPALRAYGKRHYAANTEVYKARASVRHVERRPERLTQMGLYRQTPRGKIGKQLDYQRRSQAPGVATADQIEARVAYFGWKCAYCGGPYEHLEHVKPIADGGSNWPANLRPSCQDCNLRKGTKPWRQFVT